MAADIGAAARNENTSLRFIGASPALVKKLPRFGLQNRGSQLRAGRSTGRRGGSGDNFDGKMVCPEGGVFAPLSTGG